MNKLVLIAAAAALTGCATDRDAATTPPPYKEVTEVAFANHNSRQAAWCVWMAHSAGAPEIAGNATITFAIDPLGHPTQVKMINEFKDKPEVGDCLLKKFKTWDFPKSNEKLLYTFDFIMVPGHNLTVAYPKAPTPNHP